MTPEVTIRVFGWYLALIALVLLLFPALLLSLAGLPPPTDRDYVMLGLVVGVLGFYYIRMAAARSDDFARATVIGRIAVFVGACVAAGLGAMEANYILFLILDVAGAVWTALALKRRGTPG